MERFVTPVLSQAFIEETHKRIKKEDKRFDKKIRKMLKKLHKL